MKHDKVYEELSLRPLKEKVRKLCAEEMESSIKELLFENLIDQAYYTGQVDASMSALEDLVAKKEKKQ